MPFLALDPSECKGVTDPTPDWLNGRVMDRARLTATLNWCNGSTLLGLAIARAGGATLRRGPDGLWLGEGYGLRFPVAGAFTVGNVVTTASTFAALEERTPRVLTHEAAHTRQWAYCLGLPFLPAYAATMAWSWLRTGDRAAASFFECEAGLDIGGYAEMPRRRLRDGLRALRGQVL